MSSYTGTANSPDRAKAITAVVAVHVALAVGIVTGLNVNKVRQAVEQLKTFNISEVPPPPVLPPPRPAPEPHKTPQPAAAAAPKVQPTPVFAPTPKIPAPSPVAAARVAGAGISPNSGAASAGAGTGAGGSGNGTGGGGLDYSRFTPAQLVRNLTRGDYRSIGAGRLPSGQAMVVLRIEPSGVPSTCQVLRSSGDPAVDSGLCPLIDARLRFRPALDDHGRPIPYQLQYVATWSL